MSAIPHVATDSPLAALLSEVKMMSKETDIPAALIEASSGYAV